MESRKAFFVAHVDVYQKKTPQNGWWKFHGKPYEQMDDLGGKNPLFLEGHPCRLKQDVWIRKISMEKFNKTVGLSYATRSLCHGYNSVFFGKQIAGSKTYSLYSSPCYIIYTPYLFILVKLPKIQRLPYDFEGSEQCLRHHARNKKRSVGL